MSEPCPAPAPSVPKETDCSFIRIAYGRQTKSDVVEDLLIEQQIFKPVFEPSAPVYSSFSKRSATKMIEWKK